VAIETNNPPITDIPILTEQNAVTVMLELQAAGQRWRQGRRNADGTVVKVYRLHTLRPTGINRHEGGKKMDRVTWLRVEALIVAAMFLSVSGCTCPDAYIRNCFKVGPNPCVPAGATAPNWIDEGDVRAREDCAQVEQWWTVFQDPVLDQLIVNAYSQNLSLREAGFRVLEARAQLRITGGNLFPQSQTAFGAYQRGAASLVTNDSSGVDNQFFNDSALGFNLSWELDFWGRFRRAVTAAEHSLQASCANYNQVLVTLLGDVASNYVQVRTLQQRIEYVRLNVELQKSVLDVAEKHLKAGRENAALECHQARSTLAQTESQIPQLKVAMRQACDRLCILLGRPPIALERELGVSPIPAVPATVAIGIPAELLRRRPDVQRAERLAFAQGERIGIAEAELYPAFAINGTVGVESENVSQLFTSRALTGNVGPVFQWNILNYGRIRNNMRMQDARFQALVAAYQETVLRANAEAEDGLATFLRAQERTVMLDNSVASARQAADLITKQHRGGKAGIFNQMMLIEQNLVQQQDLQAQSHGEIAQGLIQVYRALGGGWQVPPGMTVMSEATANAAPAEPPTEVALRQDQLPPTLSASTSNAPTSPELNSR
jgi:NodT family efflux transporter outer membrane factor (OMF) lipoprotein